MQYAGPAAGVAHRAVCSTQGQQQALLTKQCAVRRASSRRCSPSSVLALLCPQPPADADVCMHKHPGLECIIAVTDLNKQTIGALSQRDLNRRGSCMCACECRCVGGKGRRGGGGQCSLCPALERLHLFCIEWSARCCIPFLGLQSHMTHFPWGAHCWRTISAMR